MKLAQTRIYAEAETAARGLVATAKAARAVRMEGYSGPAIANDRPVPERRLRLAGDRMLPVQARASLPIGCQSPRRMTRRSGWRQGTRPAVTLAGSSHKDTPPGSKYGVPAALCLRLRL
jgi:hypothetical protein